MIKSTLDKFKVTKCPHCDCFPRYVLGAFWVRVDVYSGTGKKYVGKPQGNEHFFECGGGHQWSAERRTDDDEES